jgi:hypothetical protein
MVFSIKQVKEVHALGYIMCFLKEKGSLDDGLS